MSSVIRRTCEMVREMRAQGRPWLEVQHEVESAEIKQGDFRPLYVGCDSAPYRMRLAPKQEPRILSKEFHEQLTGIAQEHSLIVQMRCTGYNLFVDTGRPEDALQRIRKALHLTHRTELLRILWLDKYGIELEHPELPRIPEVVENIGSRLYGMIPK